MSVDRVTEKEFGAGVDDFNAHDPKSARGSFDAKDFVRLAPDTKLDRPAADRAIFDGGVIALRCVDHRLIDLKTIGACDVGLDKHLGF